MDKKNDFRRWVGGKKNEFRWFYTPLKRIGFMEYYGYEEGGFKHH